MNIIKFNLSSEQEKHGLFLMCYYELPFLNSSFHSSSKDPTTHSGFEIFILASCLEGFIITLNIDLSLTGQVLKELEERNQKFVKRHRKLHKLQKC